MEKEQVCGGSNKKGIEKNPVSPGIAGGSRFLER
jgi:hypothetical protein